MNKIEAGKIFKTLKLCYRNQYRGLKADETEELVNLWLLFFQQENYRLVAEALKTYVASDTKGFAPVPGQILDIIRRTKKLQEIAAGEKLTKHEAWELVMQACSHGGSAADFDKLPRCVQRAVGSASELHRMSLTSYESLEFRKNNFFARFDELEERATEYKALSAPLQRQIKQVQQAEPKQLIDPENERERIVSAAKRDVPANEPAVNDYGAKLDALFAEIQRGYSEQ